MDNEIIVAFQTEKNRVRITEMLESGGLSVRNTCRSGAEVIRFVSKIGGGLVICGFKLTDMTAANMASNLRGTATFLVIAQPHQIEYCDSEEFFKLPTPITKNDLVASVRMLIQMEERQHRMIGSTRNMTDEKIIKLAKELLMDRNLMTESEAHRFIQKRSMDTGSKMAETAKLIISTY